MAQWPGVKSAISNLSFIVVIFPESTAKRELITKREQIAKHECVRIKNIVIKKMINNKNGNKVKECKVKGCLG